MSRVYSQQDNQTKDSFLTNKSHLKRNCSCGNKSSGGGECDKCSKKNESNPKITTGRGARYRGPLEVSQPSDSTELEADRISKQLFSSVSDIGSRSLQANSKPSINESPQFKSAQREVTGAFSSNVACNRSSSDLLGVRADTGSPLPKNTRLEMESAFGTDLSDVRVHTNSGAVNVSRSLNASAFTYGNEIFFDQGKYDPNSLTGKQLLAHELTHTVQQRDAIATLAREGEGRTTFECVNQNLSSAGVASWLLAIVGTTCGLIGAIAGSPTGPGAAGTAAAAAAVCIAGVIGFSVGTVLGIISGCWDDPNFKSSVSG